MSPEKLLNYEEKVQTFILAQFTLDLLVNNLPKFVLPLIKCVHILFIIHNYNTMSY